MGAYAASEIEATLARHHHIDDEEIEGHAPHQGASILGAVRSRDAEPVLRKIFLKECPQALVIVDDEDMDVTEARPAVHGRPSPARETTQGQSGRSGQYRAFRYAIGKGRPPCLYQARAYREPVWGRLSCLRSDMAGRCIVGDQAGQARR